MSRRRWHLPFAETSPRIVPTRNPTPKSPRRAELRSPHSLRQALLGTPPPPPSGACARWAADGRGEGAAGRAVLACTTEAPRRGAVRSRPRTRRRARAWWASACRPSRSSIRPPLRPMPPARTRTRRRRPTRRRRRSRRGKGVLLKKSEPGREGDQPENSWQLVTDVYRLAHVLDFATARSEIARAGIDGRRQTLAANFARQRWSQSPSANAEGQRTRRVYAAKAFGRSTR